VLKGPRSHGRRVLRTRSRQGRSWWRKNLAGRAHAWRRSSRAREKWKQTARKTSSTDLSARGTATAARPGAMPEVSARSVPLRANRTMLREGGAGRLSCRSRASRLARRRIVRDACSPSALIALSTAAQPFARSQGDGAVADVLRVPRLGRRLPPGGQGRNGHALRGGRLDGPPGAASRDPAGKRTSSSNRRPERRGPVLFQASGTAHLGRESDRRRAGKGAVQRVRPRPER